MAILGGIFAVMRLMSTASLALLTSLRSGKVVSGLNVGHYD